MLPDWYANCLRSTETIAARPAFFIVGCQKSGTTWLQRLANAHPQVACNGEGHYGDILAPILKQALEAYNGQAKVKIEFGNPHLMSVTRFLIDQHLAATIGAKSDPVGVKAVGDKTPEQALALPILHALYPDARFVHIIRDGRDGCVSGWAHLGRQGEQGKFDSFADYIEYFTTGHWMPYIRQAQAVSGALPKQCIEFRYERLLSEPMLEVGRLFEFLGVETSEATLAKVIDESSFKNASGGRQPGEEDANSFLRKGIAGDWVNHFDEEAVERFERCAGDFLRNLGYGDPVGEGAAQT